MNPWCHLRQTVRVTAPEQSLAQRRYGATKPRTTGSSGAGRAVWIGGALVAIIATAVVLWLSFGPRTPAITVGGSSYAVQSEHSVRVSFSVTRDDPSQAVTCAVQALDASHAQVGVTLVEVPAGPDRTTAVTVDVTTFARAEQADAMENGCVPTTR